MKWLTGIWVSLALLALVGSASAQTFESLGHVEHRDGTNISWTLREAPAAATFCQAAIYDLNSPSGPVNPPVVELESTIAAGNCGNGSYENGVDLWCDNSQTGADVRFCIWNGTAAEMIPGSYAFYMEDQDPIGIVHASFGTVEIVSPAASSGELQTMGIDFDDTFTADVIFSDALLIGIWFGAFVWTARNQWLFPAAFALVGTVLPLFVGGIGVGMKGVFALFLIALLLTWASDRFRLLPHGREAGA